MGMAKKPLTQEQRDRYNATARITQKKWREENAELHRERSRQWKANNKDLAKKLHAEWRAKNRQKLRDINKETYFRLKYGISLEERNNMLAQQGGKCAICGTTSPNSVGWVIDHCHTTNKVRAILCNPCNLALGYVRDDVEIMLRMIEYIEKHKCP